VRPLALFLGALIVVACGAFPQPTGALHSETASGPFLLTLDLQKGTWAAGEQITGQASLVLTQGDAVDLGGSGGGVIAFSYAEIGGRRRLDPIWTADCAPHLLTAQKPFTEPLAKSGGFSNDDPDAEFYRAFLTAPTVALPAGIWQIGAVASFVEGAGCAGTHYDFTTTVRIAVTP
jgi:hypothetical protein